jgi:hypothetical protein
MSKSEFAKAGRSLNLRAGEWVEVRSAEEILATLDDGQCVDALPFMPEMLQYCGKRFRIYKSAHKISDTIELFTIRRMANAVFLDELRCDGASHGGCQAGCLLVWKECWLKRVPRGMLASGNAAAEPEPSSKATHCAVSPDRLVRGTKQAVAGGEAVRYRCQVTEMLRATTEVRRRDRFNPRFYVRDLTSGNVGLFNFIRFGALAMLNGFLRRWFRTTIPRVRGVAGEKTPPCDLNLQPGELVRVKSKDEIMRTLNSKSRNRGLWFDVEMLQYCGKGPFRVLRRIEKFLNEKTGEMMTPRNTCIILEGVTCSGNYSHQRMFSPRHEYNFWHEIWLERVNEDKANAGRA